MEGRGRTSRQRGQANAPYYFPKGQSFSYGAPSNYKAYGGRRRDSRYHTDKWKSWNLRPPTSGEYREEYNLNTRYYNNRVPSRPLRPPSPVEGSEEYMNRKIQHTSAIIMRHLLNPNEVVTTSTIDNAKKDEQPATPQNDLQEKPTDKTSQKIKKNNVKEIRDKIMIYISKLNEGRRRNFINSNNREGLDDVLHDMQKQKRLELSRILRDMGSGASALDKTQTIVPDIGIKIEELPGDVIEELKRTLNLDLEHLNEEIAALPAPLDPFNDNSSELIETTEQPEDTSSELNTAINSILVKEEPAIIEIKMEDIGEPEEFTNNIKPIEKIHNGKKAPDICSMSQPTEIDCVSSTNDTSENLDSIHHSITIKSDQNDSSMDTTFLQSTVPCESPYQLLSDIPNSLNSLQSIVENFVKSHKNYESVDLDTNLKNLDLVALCVKDLEDYRRTIIRSIVFCSQNSVVTQYNTDRIGGDEVERVGKRKEVDDNSCTESEEVRIKSDEDVGDSDHVVQFPDVDSKVVAIECLGSQLLLATEKGKIIFISLKDGSIQYTLDVTKCAITCMKFVKGLNDSLYMYVGSLEAVLRVCDYRKRTILKVTRISDEIQCMDAMWDYVFMGCRKGTLVRYSCKNSRVEYEEPTTGADILVLKAVQEGPRRVLLVGHRKAPIYVRDAFSGLCLRNFNNQAITPTVYSIALNNSYLYCGTAQNNILVFSFHEGHLVKQIVAGQAKGISCLKICKNRLFAGCYNGSIYVYELESKNLVSVLRGPGGGIMCIEVLNRQILVGTLLKQFHSINLPSNIFH